MIILVAAAIPLYYYSRPASNQPGTIEITGNVNNPMNVTLSQLKAETPITLQVALTSSGNPSGRLTDERDNCPPGEVR